MHFISFSKKYIIERFNYNIKLLNSYFYNNNNWQITTNYKCLLFEENVKYIFITRTLKYKLIERPITLEELKLNIKKSMINYIDTTQFN